MPRAGKYGSQHQRARKAGLERLEPGSRCVRCTHEMWPDADILNLDHDEDGTYLGFSHSSPCQTCGRRCNQSAGGLKAALLAGKRPRSRGCVICGMNYVASRGTDGSVAVTCGKRECVTAIRAIRRARDPDPQPPPQSGRRW